MTRLARQQAILRVVGERAISTQVELAEALAAEGYAVVQTTVSRDVSELGLVKVRDAEGRLVYAAPGTPDADRVRAIGAALRRYAYDVQPPAAGLVVLRTPSGFASALSQDLDEAGHERIAATVAGDDTVLVLARADTDHVALAAELARLLREEALPAAAPAALEAVAAAVRRYALRVEAAASSVIALTTPPGYASALAQAIDEGDHPSIAGTLAGDNTILVAPRLDVDAGALGEELAGYLADAAAAST